MAYVYRRPPSKPVRIPRRGWQTQGVGQFSLSSDFCTALGLTTGWCQQFAPPTPPAFPAPAGPQLPIEMSVPGAWTPEQSEIQTQQNTVDQSQQFLNSVVLPGQSAACDWTSVTWTDPTTWCGANWAIVLGGVALVGAMAFMKSKG